MPLFCNVVRGSHHIQNCVIDCARRSRVSYNNLVNEKPLSQAFDVIVIMIAVSFAAKTLFEGRLSLKKMTLIFPIIIL